MSIADFRIRNGWLVAVLLLVATGPAMADDAAVPRADRELNLCATRPLPEELAEFEARRSAILAALPADLRSADFDVVRVKVHIVRQSDGTGGLTLDHLDGALQRANQQFVAARIVFVAMAAVDYIDDDNYYHVDSDAEIDALRALHTVPGQINVYTVKTLVSGGDSICGKSSFTWSGAPQGIVLDMDCLNNSDLYPVLAHEIGHYFDLLHTHETALGTECVNGSNCATAGDWICDTPADPGLHTCGSGIGSCVDFFCSYVGTHVDPCAGQSYAPQAWNTMSYSRTACMSGFTAGQSSIAHTTLTVGRPEHRLARTGAARIFYVGTSFVGDGSWDWPYDGWWQARDALGTGDGVIAFIESSENEGAIVFDRPMTLLNTGTSAVLLGAP